MKILSTKEQKELSNILHNLWINRNSSNPNVIEFRDESIKKMNDILGLDDSNIRIEYIP